MRKPTTNPKINGQPMSFVRLGSTIESDYGYRSSRFTDSRGVEYARLSSGQVVGYPRTMCEVKQEARQSRLLRRELFRAKRRAA